MDLIKLLSQREQEVVNLLLKGKSNKQIALLLNISERTVEFHLKNIYTKLHVSSRIELVLELWKTTGRIPSIELGKNTVDVGCENVYNGNQPANETRWSERLRESIVLVRKETAMTKTIIVDGVGNFLRKHPLIFSVCLFLTVSFVVRYLIIILGLYFWLSYILLGLFLGAGGMYFGISWNKIKVGEIRFPPKVIIGLAMLPVLVAAVDMVFLNTLTKVAGHAVVNIFGIYNKAAWLISPEGKSYLYRERIISKEYLWFFAMLYMLSFAVIGGLLGKKFTERSGAATKSV